MTKEKKNDFESRNSMSPPLLRSAQQPVASELHLILLMSKNLIARSQYLPD